LTRLLVCLALGVLGVESTVSFAIPCSALVHDDDANEGSGCPDDEPGCPCPLPCPGCTGFVYAAPPPPPIALVLAPPLARHVPVLVVDPAPPAAPPHDILHVPKAV